MYANKKIEIQGGKYPKLPKRQTEFILSEKAPFVVFSKFV
jgi:hypothetical protein